jgi:hypothetical protein
MPLRFCALRALHTTSIRDLAPPSVTHTPTPSTWGEDRMCHQVHVKDLGLLLYQAHRLTCSGGGLYR